MYGMVNKAIEEMVCTGFGEETWQRIKAEAGVEEEVFISTEGYPDAVTYDLVGAASRLLNQPATEILDRFGRHWVLRTAREGYGDLMNSNGTTLAEFLQNLPNFHARVRLIFPNLVPPTFRVTDVTASSLVLHYHSQRSGLQPFVIGLLHGLGEMFATPLAIEQTVRKGEGADHDAFRLSW